MDDMDRKLLALMARDARMSLRSMADAVGMSSPGVAERIARLKQRGVIRAFTVELDPVAFGYGVEALVRIRPLPGKLRQVQKLIADTPEFSECDKVTGDDCFVARLLARSIADLDRVLDRLADLAATSTAVVKSKTIARRPPPLELVAGGTTQQRRR